MNLAELEKANGAPVTFSICECDYGGNVMNWNNGKFPTSLYMNLSYDNELQPKLESYVTKSDRGVMSKDLSPEIKTQITIEKIIVYFHNR